MCGYVYVGQKQAPKQEECGGKDNSRAEKEHKTAWRPSFMEYLSSETESQAELTAQRYVSCRRS